MLLSGCVFAFDDNNDVHITWWGYLVVALFVFIFIRAIVSLISDWVNARAELREQGLKPGDFIDCGTNMSGCPPLNCSVDDVWLRLADGVLKFYATKNPSFETPRPLDAEIKISAITGVELYDSTNVERHVTLGRVLVLGALAWILKKEERTEIVYVHVKWKDDWRDKEHETVFLFFGSLALDRATRCRDRLMRLCQDSSV